MWRSVSIWVFVFSVFFTSSGTSRALFSSEYDDAIRAAAKHYWIDFPEWKYWKAQLYQESTLEPNLCSHVGACGLAQFMPGTWDDIMRQLKWSGMSSKQAAPAIEAGAFYMIKLRNSWGRGRDALARHKLAEASYNAGLGNILSAQRLCHDALLLEGILPCLFRVTGPSNADQTIQYVTRIDRWRAMLGE